jgi:hypothetical protein
LYFWTDLWLVSSWSLFLGFVDGFSWFVLLFLIWILYELFWLYWLCICLSWLLCLAVIACGVPIVVDQP